MNEKVYAVLSGGVRTSNWCTGTRIYTRLRNAVSLAGKRNYSTNVVVEYELVPTGRVFNKRGEEIIDKESDSGN